MQRKHIFHSSRVKTGLSIDVLTSFSPVGCNYLQYDVAFRNTCILDISQVLLITDESYSFESM